MISSSRSRGRLPAVPSFRPRSRWIGSAGLLSALLCTASLSAADYFVKNGGNDSADGLSDATAWATITKVNATAFAPGDTISLKAGHTWTVQGLTVSSNGRLDATLGPINIVYKSYGTGAKPIIDLLDSSGKTGLQIQGKSYVTVQDLQLQNSHHKAASDDSPSNLVSVTSGSHHVNLLRLDVINSGNAGIQVSTGSNILVDGCFVDDSHENGIIFGGSDGVAFPRLSDSTIQNCTVQHNHGNDAFTLHDAAPGEHLGSHFVLRNNRAIGLTPPDPVEGHNEQGFDITSGSDILLEDNLSQDNYEGAIMIAHTASFVTVRRHTSLRETTKNTSSISVSAPNVTIEYSTFTTPSRDPWGGAFSKPFIRLAYDDFSVNQPPPFDHEKPENFRCVNNVFIYNFSGSNDILSFGGASTGATDITNFEFRNNIIVCNSNVTATMDFKEANRPPNYPTFLIDNNLYYAAAGSIQWRVGSTNYTFDQLRTAFPGAEAHSPTPADPQFVDFANDNFHLASTSPAKDAGANVTLTQARDRDGDSVPLGAAPDIGADEVSADAGPPPAAPSNLTATATGSSQIVLTWTDNASDETTFDIDRAANANFTGNVVTLANVRGPLSGTGGTASYTDANLTPGTLYFYRVRARSGNGPSLSSAVASASTQALADNTAPTIALSASIVFDSTVAVSATASDNIGVVGVQFLLDGSPLDSEDTGAPYGVTWDTTTSPNGTHTLTAVARDAAGNVTTSAPLALFVNNGGTTSPGGGGSVPAAPANLGATAAGFNQINLAWSDGAADEIGFAIERKKGAAGTYVQIATVGPNTTSYQDATCADSTTYVYRMHAYNGAGDSSSTNESSATTAAVTSGLAGYWKFDEGSGTTAADSSGNGNNGTLVHGPAWTTGIIGNALHFDKVDDTVSIGSGPSLTNLPAMTLSAWINPASMGRSNLGRIFQKGVGGNPTGGFRVVLHSDASMEFTIDYATSDETRTSAPSVIAINQWQHVLVTWDGSTSASHMHVYLNGREVAYAAADGDGVGARGDDTGTNLYIGTTSTGGGTFDGKIDDVRVYNRVLSAGEIAALAGAGSDVSQVAPAITGQPATQTATVADIVAFSVAASGTSPLAYQWRKDGAVIVGNASVTSSTLVLAAITTADAGAYDCVVSNAAGAATSAAATLSVNKAAANITLDNASYTFDGAAHAATATTTPADLPVSYTYNGGGTPPIHAGSYAVIATVNDANYTGSATGTLVIAPAAATVALGNLNQTWNGGAHPVSVVTTPVGLNVAVTYNGGSAIPSEPGAYAVVATVSDPDYSGSATGTLIIVKAPATVVLGRLKQTYDGTPRAVSVTTTPENLTVTVTYAGSATAPAYPGSYNVVATVASADYTGSASATLTIATAVLVRHAPVLNGGLDGSIQMLSPESTTLNGNAWVSGDLLVPGLPGVTLNGSPTFGGVLDGPGAATPTGYTVTLNGGAVLRHLVRHLDALTLPTGTPPPAPAGTRNVSINSAGQSPGDFTTLRNLTLNGNVGSYAIPPGTYGAFTANSGTALEFGTAGSTDVAVYNLQSLTLNGNSSVQILSPVVIVLANGIALNGSMGDTAHPDWLTLQVASGGVTLNGNVTFAGNVVAPAGTVTVNGNSALHGTVSADRLTINGNGLLAPPAP